jgi:oxaloacetate decarboxylase beta subunit
MDALTSFFFTTGLPYINFGSFFMMIIGLVLIYLAVKKNYEPLILIPMGFGILLSNMPGLMEFGIGTAFEDSELWLMYQGVTRRLFPPLIFLGIGAMTDFSAMISNPKLILLGAAAQFGIMMCFLGAQFLGFNILEAASIAIIGSADGPTTIYVTTQLAPHLLGPVMIAAYAYMAMVPILQPPMVKLLTTPRERLIKMKPPRIVSKTEKLLFPIVGFIVSILIAPAAAVLLGMLFLGNLLRESGVTERLAQTARTTLIDICTIMVGFTIGVGTVASSFLQIDSLTIFILGALAFMLSTGTGVLFAKLMNVFSKDKINPIIGCAAVSANPMSARVAQKIGQQYDKSNYLLLHAMAPNISGVVASAVLAGMFLGILG